MKNLDELLEDQEQIKKDAAVIKEKYRYLNLLDPDEKEVVEKRKEEWEKWDTRFFNNFTTLKEARSAQV